MSWSSDKDSWFSWLHLEATINTMIFIRLNHIYTLRAIFEAQNDYIIINNILFIQSNICYMKLYIMYIYIKFNLKLIKWKKKQFVHTYLILFEIIMRKNRFAINSN